MAQKKTEQLEDVFETFESIEQRYRNETQENRIRMMMLLAGNGTVIVGC